MKKDTNQVRRETLKTLAVSAGVVSTPYWYKPVVRSIALPAHAETSLNMSFSGSVDEVLASVSDIPQPNSAQEMIASIEKGPLDWIVEPAEANGTFTHICIAIDNGQFSADLQDDSGCPGYYTLSGNVGDGLASMDDECVTVGYFLAVDQVSPTSAMITVQKGKGGAQIMKPVSSGECTFSFGCI